VLIRTGKTDSRETPQIDWSGPELGLRHRGREHTVPKIHFPNGEDNDYSTLAELAKSISADGWDLKCCAGCVRFRFSGMSQDVSGAALGYCGLVGFRNRRGLVRIDHYCGEHQPVEGWPDDLDAADRDRIDLAEQEPARARRNAFEGSILGLAVGDALGFPVEFYQRHEIFNKFGSEGITGFVESSLQSSAQSLESGRHPAGTYSDDTQMTLAVARALIQRGNSSFESLMRSMGKLFVEWSRSPDNDRAPGRTCLQGCENLSRGVAWREAGIRNSKGCGSAMRVAPIGLYFWRDHQRLLEVARASSLLTHGHDAAIEGAAAAALMVALAMEKKTPSQTYDILMRECAPHSEDLKTCLSKLPALLRADPGEALSNMGLGEGWVAEEAVASALYCHWKYPFDFKKAVLTAANTDGDSDSIACITGGVSGALNGAASIPREWRAMVEKPEDLVKTALKLWQASCSGCR